MRTNGPATNSRGRINNLEAWNQIVGEPEPGVYVDISTQGDSRKQNGDWETTIGFAVKRPHWSGTKYFSITGSYENSYAAEQEAVAIALILFPTLTVWCDHPDVVRYCERSVQPTMNRVRYVPREQNRKAHYAARNKINFYNRRWDHGIPTKHEIQSHMQRLRSGLRSKRV